MGQVSPQEGVITTYEGETKPKSNNLFDRGVQQRAESMVLDAKTPEANEYFNRRVRKVALKLVKTGKIEQSLLALMAIKRIEVKSPRMALDTKRVALLSMEGHVSLPGESYDPEETRDHFILSIVSQLVHDRYLPEDQRLFYTPDYLRFLGNDFSFETRRRLAEELGSGQVLGQEEVDCLNDSFKILPFEEVKEYFVEHKEETQLDNALPERDTGASDNEQEKRTFFNKTELAAGMGSSDIWSKGYEDMQTCGMCFGQRKILEPVDGSSQSIPVICSNCNGTGKVPITE